MLKSVSFLQLRDSLWDEDVFQMDFCCLLKLDHSCLLFWNRGNARTEWWNHSILLFRNEVSLMWLQTKRCWCCSCARISPACAVWASFRVLYLFQLQRGHKRSTTKQATKNHKTVIGIIWFNSFLKSKNWYILWYPNHARWYNDHFN